MAVIPTGRDAGGGWEGVNLTWYGFFCAVGAWFTTGTTLFLAGAAGLGRGFLLTSALGLAPVILIASRVINRWVEGHWHGFTVGGASFAGMLAGPWIFWAASRIGFTGGRGSADALILMSALAPAYALGEGLGRLACLSFGCCYGRPINTLPVWLRMPMGRLATVLEGPLKKAAYAQGLEGVPLVPIQAMTSVVLSVAGLVGMAFFLQGAYRTALILPIVISQGWRVGSEFLRADDRGGGRLSAYQWMALAGGSFWVSVGVLWRAVGVGGTPDVWRGLEQVRSWPALGLMAAVAVTVFVRMGISTVTGARVDFHLRVPGKS